MMEIRGERYLPLEQVQLTDWVKRKAHEELGEDDETRNRCLKELREKCKAVKDAYFPNNDVFLCQFLRYRKFNTEDAFNTMVKCGRFKQKNADTFSTSKPSAFLYTFSNHIITILPYRDKDGSMIRIVHAGKWNVKEISLLDIFHAAALELLCALATDEVTQVCGMQFIFDLKGMTVFMVQQATFAVLKFLSVSFSNYLPVRVPAIHFCNEPVVFSYLWAIIRQFISRKLRNRIHFHSTDMKSLHKFIDPVILPEELGGQLKYDDSHMKRIEKMLREHYEEQVMTGFTNEPKANK